MRSIKVNLDKKVLSSYEIRIGKDIIDRMAPIIAKSHNAGRYVVITDNCVGKSLRAKTSFQFKRCRIKCISDRIFPSARLPKILTPCWILRGNCLN